VSRRIEKKNCLHEDAVVKWAVMLKSTTRSETSESLGTRPADFANAWRFPSRTKAKDPARTAILAAAAVAVAAFFASMISLFLMRPPAS
jgi:hypothetical protein